MAAVDHKLCQIRMQAWLFSVRVPTLPTKMLHTTFLTQSSYNSCATLIQIIYKVSYYKESKLNRKSSSFKSASATCYQKYHRRTAAASFTILRSMINKSIEADEAASEASEAAMVLSRNWSCSQLGQSELPQTSHIDIE